MSEETIPQMREQIDSLTADLSKERTEREKLAKENRKLSARDVAREQGYSAKAGELFASANPDAEITAEALDSFVVDYGLGVSSTGSTEEVTESSEEGENATEVAGSADLGKMAGGGSRPGDSAGGATPERMTRSEWQELHANDPVAAREAVRQGRVEIARDNPFGDAQAVAVGANPYAS